MLLPCDAHEVRKSKACLEEEEKISVILQELRMESGFLPSMQDSNFGADYQYPVG